MRVQTEGDQRDGSGLCRTCIRIADPERSTSISKREAVSGPSRRFVIVVRAAPVICGHSTEARSLAEVALTRGFDDVRIVTWPLERLTASGLPLKAAEYVLPYSPGITVERPEPVGDAKVIDGRYSAGITGRLVELFTDGVPTVAMSLYIAPHADIIAEARRVACELGACDQVTTIAEAVGSDVTNAVRTALESERIGTAARVLASYLDADHLVAVSQYTKDLIVHYAHLVDARLGSQFAAACERRIEISYPAIDSSIYIDLDSDTAVATLARRGLRQGSYALFLSRLMSAKGMDDVINGYRASAAKDHIDLVIAGRGPAEDQVSRMVAESGLSERIHLILDFGDTEKAALMAGSAAFVLPSRTEADFTETFGIVLAEKMLAGGGPVITCATGGIPEAVGDAAVIIPPYDPGALATALDDVVLHWDEARRRRTEQQARAYAMQFDRFAVFDRLMRGLPSLAGARQGDVSDVA